MKALLISLVLSSLLFCTQAIAGSGHDHGHSHAQVPVDKETVEKNSVKVINELIETSKLDKSWASIAVNSSEKKAVNGGTEWLVTFVNQKITDTKKQKLYIFLTLGGEYIAANHTGK